MALDKVWVFAEGTEGAVKTITLEMLAKAREIGDEVACIYGGDGDALAHVGVEPVFGGTTNVRTRFTGDGPKIVLVRPKSFAAEPSGGSAADVEDLDVPD